MKFTLAIATAILASVNSVSALPSNSLSTRQLPDDPSPVPVDVKNLDHDISKKCGSTNFDYHEIYKAVQWGILLQNADVRRGQKSNEFPKGRFPHSYTDTQFDFGSDCPSDDNRQEFPLVTNGPYNGGLNNKKWGDHRVVYYYEPGEINEVNSNPVGYFCGTITHAGAETGKFIECE